MVLMLVSKVPVYVLADTRLQVFVEPTVPLVTPLPQEKAVPLSVTEKAEMVLPPGVVLLTIRYELPVV
jgi:hypothetical protein